MVNGVEANQHWKSQAEALGALIRTQRRLADLSLREMATMTRVSNAYLSQLERGLHQPSVRVLTAIAQALNVSPDDLLAEAGLLRQRTPGTSTASGGTESNDAGADAATAPPPGGTEAAILADPALTDEQRQALLSVYRSFVPPRAS